MKPTSRIATIVTLMLGLSLLIGLWAKYFASHNPSPSRAGTIPKDRPLITNFDAHRP